MPFTYDANKYLNDFHNGHSLPLGFPKALAQLQLDYSPDSLERIERLLGQIRSQLKPTPAFIEVEENWNFIRLLTYYTGTVIARYTLQRIEWLTREELPAFVPAEQLREMPDNLFTRQCAALFQGDTPTALLFPFAPVTLSLLESGDKESLVDFAETYLRRCTKTPILKAPNAQAAPAPAAADPCYSLHQLGMLIGAHAAAVCRIDLESGHDAAPLLMHENANGERTMVSMQFYGDMDTAFNAARQSLQSPETAGLRATSFAYDGHINLPRFRTDALIIEARWFSPDTHVEIAIPYRSAKRADGFALFAPRLLSSSLSPESHALLEAALFAGMDSFNPPGLWQQYHIDENQPENQDARTQEQTAAAPLLSLPEPADQAAPLSEIHLADIRIADCIARLPAAEQHYAKIAEAEWLLGSRLQFLLDDAPRLLKEGRVVWGHLVRANTALFAKGDEAGLPGDIIYDPQGQCSPEALAPAAHEVFSWGQQVETLRASLPPNSEKRLLAEIQADDYSCARANKVPGEPPHVPAGLLLSSTYFSRHHLPAGYLLLNYFPILIHDQLPGSAMVLPSRFWPGALLTRWEQARKAASRDDWRQRWQTLCANPSTEDQEYLHHRLQAIRDYIQHGLKKKQITEKMHWGFQPFTANTQPPPMAWEWGIARELSSLAEQQTRSVERKRARNQALDAQLARQAFATRYTAQMMELHSRLLEKQRGLFDSESLSRLFFTPEEIQYVALGFIAGAEQAALHMARILCAVWQIPDIYYDAKRPEVRAVFMLFAQHLGIKLPELPRFKALPVLESLIDNQRWCQLSAEALAPLLEAACIEHTEEAPHGPFEGLPIALALMLKLRSRQGLSNPPQIKHPLLSKSLEPWAAPAEFADCLDQPLRELRARLLTEGYDEEAIAAAVLEAKPLVVQERFAHPAPASPQTAAAAQGEASPTGKKARLKILLGAIIGGFCFYSAFSPDIDGTQHLSGVKILLFIGVIASYIAISELRTLLKQKK